MRKFTKIFLGVSVFCLLFILGPAIAKAENVCVEGKTAVKSCQGDSKLGCYGRKTIYDKIKGSAFIDTKCNYGCENGVCLKEPTDETKEDKENIEPEEEANKPEESEDPLFISNKGLAINSIQSNNKSEFFKIADKGFIIKPAKDGIILKEYTSGGFSVESKTPLVYENGNLISSASNKEIKIFPSDIRQKITGITSIKLVDEGSPKYVVDTKEKGKLFGFIPISINTVHEVDAQSGEIAKIHQPWWKFLTQIVTIKAQEGDFCWLNSENPTPNYECDSGLRCEDVLNTSDTIGLCRIYPAVFHGRLVYIWDSWSEAEQYFDEYWPSIPFSEAREWLHETEDGVEVAFYKWIDWYIRANSEDVSGMKAHFMPLGIFGAELIGIDQDNLDENGNFSMNYMGPGKYSIMTELVANDNSRVHQYWEFTVNDASLTPELNICGNAYNDYHKIRIVGTTMWVPPSPPLSGLDTPPPDPCD